MASVNQATVIGFLGDEPRTITTKTNNMMCSFSVATTEKGFTRQDGTQVPDKTEWHNIVLFGKLAEIAARFLHKGSSVYIQGKMRTRSYDDKNGSKRYITEIEADTMQMLDRKDSNNGGNAQQATAAPQYASSPYQQQTSQQSNNGNDDLPF